MGDFSSFIESLLLSAADIAVRNFGNVVGVVKATDNNQVLSETDKEIGSFIIHRLQQTYPDHNIIDEEAGVIDRRSNFTWVVDPIDGTSNFVNGVLTYGIMVGLLQDDKPIAAGVSLPELQEIYLAEKNKGTYCNHEKIAVSHETKLSQALVAYGIDGHQENPELTKQEAGVLTDIVLHIRNLRSSNSVFDQMMVARGCYGASLNRTSKIWDNVAQQILIEEAGGIYTDFYGKPIDYSLPLSKAADNFTWCTGNHDLHAQLQQIIGAQN